jgi:hypothetical protein
MHSFRSIAAKANANHIVGHKIESRRKPAAFDNKDVTARRG